MLRRQSKIVAECHRRALEAAERAARSSSREDREFWLLCEQRWLDHAKQQEDSERLNDFVQSRSKARDIADNSEPTAEETLRLVSALNSIIDPDKRDEILRLAEQMAGSSPRFAEFLQRLRPKN
jgi:hypothetical protein